MCETLVYLTALERYFDYFTLFLQLWNRAYPCWLQIIALIESTKLRVLSIQINAAKVDKRALSVRRKIDWCGKLS